MKYPELPVDNGICINKNYPTFIKCNENVFVYSYISN